MINVSLISLLGIVDFAIAIAYLILSPRWSLAKLQLPKVFGTTGIILLIIQVAIALPLIIGSGIIFAFQGWRLNIPLRIAYFSFYCLLFFLGLRNFYRFPNASQRLYQAILPVALLLLSSILFIFNGRPLDPVMQLSTGLLHLVLLLQIVKDIFLLRWRSPSER
ncbi:MAG: hypothetical protein LRZ84_04370 [Desertifilum sp.]|nr:hypothetical protein [Desertifilum sp.]